MPAVTVRNISLETHIAIKKRAQREGRSTEAQIRLILDEAARKEPKVGLGTLLQEFGRKYGPLPEIVRDKSPSEPAIFE
jgi:plasmid stability protein